MTPRERTDAGTYAETVTLEDVLGVFDAVRGPSITSSDVADALDCTTEAARQKLTRLYDQGKVEKRKSGRTVLYWRLEEPDTGEPSEQARDTAEDTPADRTATEPVSHPHSDDALEDVEFPAGRDREECRAAVNAAREHLREQGGATKRELVEAIMPDYPLGYDVEDALEKVEAGERYRGAWWRHVVKPGLEALDDVEAPPTGGSTWRVV